MKKLSFVILLSLTFPLHSFAHSGHIHTENPQVFSESEDATNELIAQVKNIQGKQTTVSLQKLSSLSTKRKEARLRLAKESPRLFINSAMKKTDRALLPISIQKDVEQAVTKKAKLSVIHVDDFNNQDNDEYRYTLVSGKIKTVFYPTSDISKYAGSYVQISGYQIGDVFVAGTDGTSTFQVLNSASNIEATVEHKTFFFLVDLVGSKAKNFTRQEAYDAIFTGPFQQLMREQSYGRASFSGGVSDWIFVNKVTQPGVCGIVTLDDQEIKDYIASHNINIGAYNHIVFLLPGGGGCSSVGVYDTTIGNTTYTISTSWVGYGYGFDNYSYPYPFLTDNSQPFFWSTFHYVLAHELGHAMGLLHASGLDCDTKQVDINCTRMEYGSVFDLMGSNAGTLHYSGIYKAFLGWILPSETLTITSSGHYTLNPLEYASSTIKFGNIKMLGATSTVYSLEYRQAVGFDAKLKEPPFILNQTGLLVSKIEDDERPHTLLLDASPTNLDWYTDISQDAVLHSGETFTDTATGVTIKNVTIGTSSIPSLSFDVDIISPTCIQGGVATIQSYLNSATTTPGNIITITNVYRNLDTISCSPREYQYSVSSPQDFSVIRKVSSPSDGIVSPNGMLVESLDLLVSTSTPTGSYTIGTFIIDKNTGIVLSSSTFPVTIIGDTPLVAQISQSKDTTTAGEPFTITWGNTGASACSVTISSDGNLFSNVFWAYNGQTQGTGQEVLTSPGVYYYKNLCIGYTGVLASSTLMHVVTPFIYGPVSSSTKPFITLLSKKSGNVYQRGDVIKLLWNIANVDTVSNSFGLSIYSQTMPYTFLLSETVGNSLNGGSVSPQGVFDFVIPQNATSGNYVLYISTTNAWYESTSTPIIIH